MKKLVLVILIALLIVPAIFSLAARHWMQERLLDNFPAGTEISHSEFDLGWLKSQARVTLVNYSLNLAIQTRNTIHNGPLLWMELVDQPSAVFNAYKIDTKFDFASLTDHTPWPDNPGQAVSQVSYTGKIKSDISHPGLELSVDNKRLYIDLPESSFEFKPGETSQAIVEANQIDFTVRDQNIYLVQPEIMLEAVPEDDSRQIVSAAAVSVFGTNRSGAYRAEQPEVSINLERRNNSVDIDSLGSSKILIYNQARMESLEYSLKVKRLTKNLVDYISTNQTAISMAITSNQWLALITHATELTKLLSLNNPDLKLIIKGMHNNSPVAIEFSATLESNNGSALDPFSLLENFTLNLIARIPVGLVELTENAEIIMFFQSLVENGLLINQQQSYYANLSLENGKLKADHLRQ